MSTPILTFSLPWPPSGNHRNGFSKGRVYNTPKYKAYKHECYLKTKGLVSYPIDYYVTIEMLLYPPDKRRRDRDNYVKPLQDTLTYCRVWEDDYLARRGDIEMMDKDSNPRVEVRISPYIKRNILSYSSGPRNDIIDK